MLLRTLYLGRSLRLLLFDSLVSLPPRSGPDGSEKCGFPAHLERIARLSSTLSFLLVRGGFDLTVGGWGELVATGRTVFSGGCGDAALEERESALRRFWSNSCEEGKSGDNERDARRLSSSDTLGES